MKRVSPCNSLNPLCFLMQNSSCNYITWLSLHNPSRDLSLNMQRQAHFLRELWSEQEIWFHRMWWHPKWGCALGAVFCGIESFALVILGLTLGRAQGGSNLGDCSHFGMIQLNHQWLAINCRFSDMRALFGNCCAGFSRTSRFNFRFHFSWILERFGRRIPSSYGIIL